MAKICFILILITCGILQLLRSLPRKDGTFFSCGRKKIEKIEHNKFGYYYQWCYTSFLILVLSYLIYKVLISE